MRATNAGWTTRVLITALALGLGSNALRADHAPFVRFQAPSLTLWAGKTQAIPFAMTSNATEPTEQPDAAVGDESIVEILRGPEVLPGYETGFLRVRALRLGRTTLRIGEAEVPVEVKAPARTSDLAPRPRLVGVANGSCVWGRFAVAVEWQEEDGADSGLRPALRLPDGRLLAPAAVTPPDAGPMRLARFELDAADLPAGRALLTPIVGVLEGDAAQILTLRPTAERIRAGECEDTANARRPGHFRNPKPTSVVADRTASGGKAVANFSPDPVWTLPLEVAQAGYYQLALVARGTNAGGALPSVGVYVNESDLPAATARLAATGWHRLVVGRPIRLEAGSNLLSVRFENDFFAGKGVDRNLWLDRYELVRVFAGRAQAPALATPLLPPEAPLVASAPVEPPMEADELAAGEFLTREEAALAELGSGIQVALTAPTEDRRIEAEEIVRIAGWCRGSGGKDGLTTTLLLNGKPTGQAKGEQPKFTLPATAFAVGENRIELETTRADGNRARSAEQLVWRAAQLRRTPAAVRIDYPAAGQVLGTAEGVIAHTPGLREAAAWAELLVDGEPFGPRVPEPDPAQPLFFPLPVHSLAPGGHALSVRLAPPGKEKAGLQSEVVKNAVEPAPAGAPAGRFQRALRLLDRFAYGAEPRELARLLEQGEERWLDERLGESLDPARATAWQAALSLFPAARKEDGAATSRALTAMLLETNPVRLRFTLWAENHFSTWIQKTGGHAKWLEHRTFARLGVAPFGELLLASATSPAMLQYLDQQKSVAGKSNENYARELLELHTLGVRGGYTQTDVTRLASLLTGWMTAQEAFTDPARGPATERAFRFDPALNEGGGQEVFGVSYPDTTPADRFDRVRHALEVLAAHPVTARFICTKLAAHYVSPEPPAALVEALAAVFLATGGDLRAVLREIPRRPEFWQAAPRMTSPLDYALRLARVSGSRQPGPVSDFLRRSGTGLFDRPSPDGYPESDLAYADPQALSQRWRFAQSFALPALEKGDDTAVAPRDPIVRRAEREAALQFAAVRLTGRPLEGRSLAAAHEMLVLKPGQRRAELIREAAQIIAQLPEVQLR